MKKTLLWLDDRRSPFEPDWIEWLFRYGPIEPPYDTVWARSYNEFTDWISQHGLPDAICWDHDLGDFTGPNGSELRGMDCAKWLVEHCLDNNIRKLPLYSIQTSNSGGRDDIDGLLKSFIKQIQ